MRVISIIGSLFFLLQACSSVSLKPQSNPSKITSCEPSEFLGAVRVGSSESTGRAIVFVHGFDASPHSMLGWARVLCEDQLSSPSLRSHDIFLFEYGTGLFG